MEINTVGIFVTLGISIPLLVAVALSAARRSSLKVLDRKSLIVIKLIHIGNKISEFIKQRFAGINNINHISFSPEITKEFLKSLNRWKKSKEWKDKKIHQLGNFIFLLGLLTIIFTIISIISFIFCRQSVSNISIIDEKLSIVIITFTGINIVCSVIALMEKSSRIWDALAPKYLK